MCLFLFLNPVHTKVTYARDRQRTAHHFVIGEEKFSMLLPQIVLCINIISEADPNSEGFELDQEFFSPGKFPSHDSTDTG